MRTIQDEVDALILSDRTMGLLKRVYQFTPDRLAAILLAEAAGRGWAGINTALSGVRTIHTYNLDTNSGGCVDLLIPSSCQHLGVTFVNRRIQISVMAVVGGDLSRRRYWVLSGKGISIPPNTQYIGSTESGSGILYYVFEGQVD